MATSIGSSASEIGTNYMNLLITQLRYQDPTAPMDNSAMASNLAQLAQLQQLETMNSSFAGVLQAEQMNQAVAMIGKQVTFLPDGADTTVTAKVDSVATQDGAAVLKIGSYAVPPSKVLNVFNT